MKNSNLFYILFCMISLATLPGCENAELTKHNPNTRIEPRIDDCEECPIDDCCCAVELLTDIQTVLTFCGTTSPDNLTTSCGPNTIEGCSVQGFILNLNLNGISDSELFCASINSAFSISSSNTNNHTVRVTCQAPLGSQSIDIDFSGGNTEAVQVGEGCRVEQCEN